MPTLVPGNKGFSLIELLVVLALVAVATATLTLALRNPAQAQLEREGERLVTLLETARAEARASGLTVRWRPATTGGTLAHGQAAFAFIGLPQRVNLPQHWLGEAPAVELDGNAPELLLGPEPLLPRQGLRLRLADRQLRISSDGLKPFALDP